MVNTMQSGMVLTLDNPAFCSYLLCTGLLVLKMMAVTLLTIFHRMKNKAFISPEDATWGKGEVVQNDAVERTRRAHQNDLENILMFIAVSFCYLWTMPAPWLAHLLFFAFTIVRCVHTVVYAVFVVPQPTRAICFLTGFAITGYMAIHVVIYVFIHML